jgi:hypothetical protein
MKIFYFLMFFLINQNSFSQENYFAVLKNQVFDLLDLKEMYNKLEDVLMNEPKKVEIEKLQNKYDQGIFDEYYHLYYDYYTLVLFENRFEQKYHISNIIIPLTNNTPLRTLFLYTNIESYYSFLLKMETVYFEKNSDNITITCEFEERRYMTLKFYKEELTECEIHYLID